MCGNFNRLEGRGRDQVVPGRLWVALIVSILFHSIFFMLLMAERTGTSEERLSEGNPLLQVRLSDRANYAIRVSPSNSTKKVDQQSKREIVDEKVGGAVSELSVALGYEAPEIISDIPFSMPELKSGGFMVLRLEVDEVGRVASAEVVYSNMPSEATGRLLFRFSQARFKPARNAGKVIVDDILLQIDVD